MHALEKIIAKHANRTAVQAGDIVTAKIDFAEINDLYLQTVYSFYEMGGKKVWDKDKVTFVFDHYAPCPTLKAAENHKEMRAFAKENGLTHHFDINAGVCHQVLPENGLVRPGTIVVGTDSHTTTYGAFGAFGTGCGATDMACILLSGELWFRVPEVVEVRLEGRAPGGVYPKDVILHVLAKVRADGAIYKAIDFTGSYVEQLDVPGRMTLCNMAVEMGAKTAYMQPNAAVLDYVSRRAARPWQPEETDSDFCYAQSYVFDVSAMEPAVACPHSVDNVCTVTEAARLGVELNEGYIGSCTNGRTEDIAQAAAVLKGRHIPPYARLIVVPASAKVLEECMEKGYIRTLLEAGATLNAPGCAACLGTHEGLMAAGENCITSTNRNFRGRMGSNQANLYLASPATVAASILNGRITDPRGYLD